MRKNSSKSDRDTCTSISGVFGQDTPPGDLWETKHLISGLFDSPAVGIAVCDKRFRFKAINPALAAMNGVPVESHLNKTIYQVLGDLAQRIQPAFKTCRQGEQAHHVYLLLKGLVKVCGTTHAGKEVLLDWMQPGSLLGLVRRFLHRQKICGPSHRLQTQKLLNRRQLLSAGLPNLVLHFTGMLCELR